LVKLLRCICTALIYLLFCAPVFAAVLPMANEQIIRHNVGGKITHIDPALSTTLPEMNIQLQAFEGLTRVAADGAIVTGTAKSWEVLDQDTRYVFHLRTAAKWSNGSPVTAYDFEYAWKRLLDPAADAYNAHQAYVIKNGEAYYTGKITDVTQLGVRALDQWTLEVVLEKPVAYFLTLVAYPPFLPVNKAIVEQYGSDWATSPATYVSNGPFRLKYWAPVIHLEFEKNPHYWDASNVKLSRLFFTLSDSVTTELTKWENRQIDSTHTVPASQIQRLKAEGKLSTVCDLGTYFYVFNTRVSPLDDPKARKALALAIDRKNLVEQVTRGNQIPAYALVPYGMPDSKYNEDFRVRGSDYFAEDHSMAKALLTEAGYPGGVGFPPLTILYSASVIHRQIAQAIAKSWQQNLGIKVTLVEQEWEDYLQSLEQGDYQVARFGWTSAYLDAITFLELWQTEGENNNTFWSNTEYDLLLETAQLSEVRETRIQALHDAEQVLMDEMPVMPIYFLTRPYLQSDAVQGVVRSPLGYIDFKSAWRAVE
jgi:oligopeptide transport system substrate-binding protein